MEDGICHRVNKKTLSHWARSCTLSTSFSGNKFLQKQDDSISLLVLSLRLAFPKTATRHFLLALMKAVRSSSKVANIVFADATHSLVEGWESSISSNINKCVTLLPR